jgi:rod shape-determining protein MreC
MSYSNRFSFFLKVKSISQHNSSSFFKKIASGFFISLALLILCIPIINKKFRIAEDFFDDKLHSIYNKSAVINSNVKGVKENFFNIFSLIQKNAELKSENERLNVTISQLSCIALENEDLKKMNNFVFPKTKRIASTRLIFRSDGQVTRAKILAGKDAGVKSGQFVVSSNGALLGNIISVSNNTAKLLLINEPKSKLSVRFPRINNKAILSGNYNANLKIALAQSPTIPANGDLVTTSGDDGHLPSGLLVGMVALSGDNDIEIIPSANPSNSDFVSILELENNGKNDSLDAP